MVNQLTQQELKALPPDGGPKYNRLIFEKSPYLLQHAANPVDWYPWGNEAFERAKREDKPIFLSIGYATCHWCHVMEHESFEDSTVAALMNEAFVCIKVDREERPDIDNVYMAVAQAMTGHGGWPLTILMTPDKKPFFTGTYFSKESRYGRTGMLDLIPAISDAWKNRKSDVLQSAQEITDAVTKAASESVGGQMTVSLLDSAFQMYHSQYDARYGGFGNSPKFPTAHNLSFLLRYWKRTGNPEALAMVENTLQAMRKGGLCDHIGFGFHRYSTDARWFLPHFEKMLYDQAMLSIAYTEAFQATGKMAYKQAAEEIFTYVLRDLTDPEGGFYSAEDADSEGEEGRFYLWTAKELEDLLGAEDADFIRKVFNCSAEGNYYEEATKEFTGTNILFLSKDPAQLQSDLKLSEGEFVNKLSSLRAKLFEAREKRIHPLKDDKVLTDWNGLMIAALAKAGVAFQEPKYTHAAERAALFVLAKLRQPDGRLVKRFRQGEAGLPAHADDYAFMVWGLLELYEATFRSTYLKEAIVLNAILTDHFWDKAQGGFFFTSDDGETLITRPKELYDGAIPSANSVAALNLVRLGRITGNNDFNEMSEKIGMAFSASIQKVPMMYGQFLNAMDFAFGPSFEIVIVGKAGQPEALEMLRIVNEGFLPNKIVVVVEDSSQDVSPLLTGYISLNGRPTVYVCQNYACQRPTTDPQELRRILHR